MDNFQFIILAEAVGRGSLNQESVCISIDTKIINGTKRLFWYKK